MFRAPLTAPLPLAFLLACGASGDPDPAGSPYRVALLADSHVIGPDYVCCSESEGIDNDSIMKGPERLARALDSLAALDPPVDAIFLLGDVMHDAYPHGDAVDAYDSAPSAFTRSAALLADAPAPVHLVWGNHDYEVRCGEPGRSIPRVTTAALLERHHGQAGYRAVDLGPWRFVLLDGQQGPTWEVLGPACDTSFASYGAEQLAWLDGQLAEGRPTFVLTHYMDQVTARDEDPGGPHPDLVTVLARHDNVQASFVGHTHRWLDFTRDPDWSHTVLGAVRYDADNFWLLDLDASGSDWTQPDLDKARWFTPCADTWDYTNVPVPLDAPEEGDCG